MRIWWVTVVTLVCCVAMRENFTLIFNSLGALVSNSSHQDELPSQAPQVPIIPEGEEVERLTSGSADEAFCLFTISSDANPFLWSILHTKTLPYPSSSRELLSTLQRLCI
jgi:hypothetical protein